MRALAGRDLLWRSGGHDPPSRVPAFGSEVDDVVGHLDHVQMMFDEEHRVVGGWAPA
jgi:hypothetical protein